MLAVGHAGAVVQLCLAQIDAGVAARRQHGVPGDPAVGEDVVLVQRSAHAAGADENAVLIHVPVFPHRQGREQMGIFFTIELHMVHLTLFYRRPISIQ